MRNESDLCFAVTQNKYSKPLKPDSFNAGCLIFDKQGNKVCNINQNGKYEDWARGVTDLRYYRDLINFDNGVVINLDKLPEKARSIVFYLQVNNVGAYSGEAQIKLVKNSAYGIQFYRKAIPIFKEDIGATIKWQELNKPAEGGAQGGAQEAKSK